MLGLGVCRMGAPELVMFDEPSLGLAPTIVQHVLAAIRDLNAQGLTCVLVEQNVAVSLRLANRAYVLENGRITLAGSGDELLADDRVRQAYLGLWVLGYLRAARSAAMRIAAGSPDNRAAGAAGPRPPMRAAAGPARP